MPACAADPNGPAAQAGIQSFSYSTEPVRIESVDVLQRINGTAVKTRQDYRDALSGVSVGQSVSVELLRAEQNGPNTTMSMSVPAEQLLPDVTAGGQALLEAIWKERRVELAMEQHRYFDLIRQGRAGDVLDNFQPKHKLYPIPQSEIDLSGGALSQNDY